MLAASNDSGLQELAPFDRELATSISDGIKLSRRVGPEQLGIPLNKQFDGRLALVKSGQKAIKFGTLSLTVIGPFREDLDEAARGVGRRGWRRIGSSSRTCGGGWTATRDGWRRTRSRP